MRILFHNTLIFIFVVLSISDLFVSSSPFPPLIACMILSMITFSLGVSRFQLSQKKSLVLLAINLIILGLGFRYRFFLFNSFILSFVLWSMITPLLVRYHKFLSLTVIASLLAVYYFSIVGTSVPLFPLLYYPLYVLGYHISSFKLSNSKPALLALVLNLCFASACLFVLWYKVRILHLTDHISMLFFGALKPSAQFAMYAPFLFAFGSIVVLSINLYLYSFTTIYDQNPQSIDDLSENGTSVWKPIWQLLLFFAVTGGMVFFSKYVYIGNIKSSLMHLLLPQTIFNLIFLASIFLIMIVLLGRGLSTVIFTILCFLLIFANYIKLRFFNEPFYPWDIYLIKNAIMISGKYISASWIILLGVAATFLIGLGIYFRTHLKKHLGLQPNLFLLPFAVILIYINITTLSTPGYLSDLNIKKSWYIGKEEILKNGVFVQNYFYLSELDKYMLSKPEGYSQQLMNQISSSLEQQPKVTTGTSSNSQQTIKPNVVVIMSEAFWDPSNMKGVTYNLDITPNLKKYQKGYIISPVFGGGTANTEFEALTGLSTYFFSPGVIPYNVYLRKETPSIVTAFRDNGYSTTAMHPNVGSFYNRSTVYPHLGFDEFLDISNFQQQQASITGDISDAELVAKILSKLDDPKNKNPKFIFAVTMQNHDPYYKIYKSTKVKATSPKLDEVEKSILDNYSQNIYDADKALGKLIESLQKSKQPTLVYFFGDHLPRLGQPYGFYDIYGKFDYFKGTKNLMKDLRLYRTPYVKWSNYKSLAESIESSPVQIAIDILKDSDITYPSYFNILLKLRDQYPILNNHFRDQIEDSNSLLKDYKLIEYDLMFGKQYLK